MVTRCFWHETAPDVDRFATEVSGHTTSTHPAKLEHVSIEPGTYPGTLLYLQYSPLIAINTLASPTNIIPRTPYHSSM